MIEFKKGDILTEHTEAVVNTVNCVGIMGKGIAAQFKKMYPDNFKSYFKACKNQEVQPGRMFTSQVSQLTNPKYVINFPTKRDWRAKSKIDDIKSGLVSLGQEIQRLQLQSISIPPLGCGLGGLNWGDVKPLIEALAAANPNTKFVVFTPNADLAAVTAGPSKDVPDMTFGRASLVVLIHEYLNGLLDPFLTLLEIHKLMYFMKVAGELPKLKYSKGIYGPYSENLRHVLSKIEGHLLTGFADGEEEPGKVLSLLPGAVEDAQDFLSKHDSLNHIDKVKDLVQGFESSYGLELLSTVHWVVTQENAKSPEHAKDLIYKWNERKKMFTHRQIQIAFETLETKGWFALPNSH